MLNRPQRMQRVMPLTLTPQQTGSSLPQRLSRLRGRLRAIIALRQGSQAIALIVLVIALLGFLDWRFDLPALVRACSRWASGRVCVVDCANHSGAVAPARDAPGDGTTGGARVSGTERLADDAPFDSSNCPSMR